jgi:hypothetical protein
MIYLFHGSNAAKVRSKAFQWVNAARAKEPEASYIRISAESLTEESLQNALQVQGLFYTKTLVLLDDPFSESAAGDVVLEHLSELAASANPVAIVTPKLLSSRLKKIEPHATRTFEENIAERHSSRGLARGFNSALVNALGAKDGAALWKEIIKAERAGDVPEMIHGLLHWKARDLIQKGSRTWSPQEARMLSRQLIELLSGSRNNSLPLPLALERFALTLGNAHIDLLS